MSVTGFRKKDGTIVKYDYDALDNLPSIPSGAGLSDDAKQALLTLLGHVAYTDEHGEEYYTDLYDALYPPAEIVSISATFTQGENLIYDTDTLDTLRQYLVVTASYDDSSTQTVTTYTLSGTLTAGTSTISVAYDGKTTTFTVTVTHVESGEVEMMTTVQHQNMSSCPIYSDGGETTYRDARFPTSNGKSLRSTTVFSADTRVKIICAPTSNMFQCFLFTSSLWDGTTAIQAGQTTPAFYYAQSSSSTYAYGWSTATHTFEYTVKAGYALTIICISSTINTDTAISVEVA